MAKREFKKRAKITQRLNEISRLEDPWEKAESLLKFLRKVDRSLLSETCRLAISMMPEAYHQIQIFSRLQAAHGVAQARKIIAKYGSKKILAEFDEAVLELKNLNFI